MAGVQDLNDVGVLIGDNLGCLSQLPWAVRKRDAHFHIAPSTGHTAADDALHDHGVDVAATQDDDGRASGLDLAGQDCCDSYGTSWLNDHLGALEQNQDGARGVVVADRDYLVDHLFDDVEVQGAGFLNSDTVTDCRAHGDFNGVACFQRRRVGGGVFCLDTDHSDLLALFGCFLLDGA